MFIYKKIFWGLFLLCTFANILGLCPQDYVEVSGVCVQPSITCPPDYFLVNGMCFPNTQGSCEPGEVFVNGKCCTTECLKSCAGQSYCPCCTVSLEVSPHDLVPPATTPAPQPEPPCKAPIVMTCTCNTTPCPSQPCPVSCASSGLPCSATTTCADTPSCNNLCTNPAPCGRTAPCAAQPCQSAPSSCHIQPCQPFPCQPAMPNVEYTCPPSTPCPMPKPIVPNYPCVPPCIPNSSPPPPLPLTTQQPPPATVPPTIPTTTSAPPPLTMCPPGTILVGNTCRLIYCGKGFFEDNRCIQTVCPAGTFWTGIKCAPPQPTVQTVDFKTKVVTHFNHNDSDIIVNNINNFTFNNTINLTDNESTPPSSCGEEEDCQTATTTAPSTSNPQQPEPKKCCNVLTPRVCSPNPSTGHWNCYTRRYRRCGEFCVAPTIYLKAPKMRYVEPYLVMPPDNKISHCRQSSSCGESKDYYECAGCASGYPEFCSPYCYRTSCLTRGCAYFDQHNYCKDSPGTFGCRQEDGCFDDWCG